MDTTRSPEIDAVIFDLDGLMLNTEDVFSMSGRELLARRGHQMTDEIHQSMLGRRPEEAFQALKDRTGIADSIDALKQETYELFHTFAENHLETMPGLVELLDLIEETGIPKAVATSSPRDYMQDMLGRFNLLHRFSFALTAEDVSRGKPHPEIYLLAATRLSVSPARMLVLEDSEPGTRAASSAGALAISIPNEHTDWGDFSMAWKRADSLAAPEIRALFGA